MKLSERFQDMTEHELRRAIQLRQSEIGKTESEIRAIQKLLRRKLAALPETQNHMAAGRTNG